MGEKKECFVTREAEGLGLICCWLLGTSMLGEKVRRFFSIVLCCPTKLQERRQEFPLRVSQSPLMNTQSGCKPVLKKTKQNKSPELSPAKNSRESRNDSFVIMWNRLWREVVSADSGVLKIDLTLSSGNIQEVLHLILSIRGSLQDHPRTFLKKEKVCSVN